MLIDPARSHLVIIDVQQRLLPAVLDAEQTKARIEILGRAAGRLSIPVTVTEQYPTGLGPTDTAILEAAPNAVVLPKMSFSAANEALVRSRVDGLRASGRNQLVVCGTEAHVCVLQTALGFRAAGYELAVVADAVSSRTAASISAACARLLHAGCHWVTVEMVLFEWLEQAGTDDFRALLPLIR